jgi:O-antigen/teichoic acid export membrane protein
MEFAIRSLRLLGFRVVTVGTLMLITVLTARWLGPEGRGTYVLVAVIYSTIGVTFLGGMGSALAYQISNQGKSVREVVANALVLALAIGTLALLVSLVVYWVSGGSLWWLVVVGAAQPPLLCATVLTWAFLGADDHRNYNRAIIAPSALTLLLLLLLLGPGRLLGRGEASAQLALVAWLLAQIATVGWMLWLGRHRWFPLPLHTVVPASVLTLMTFGVQTGLADLISYFNYRVDVLVLEWLRGSAEVGVYSVAVTIAEGLWFISSAIGVAIYARVGQLPKQQAAELTARSMRHAVFLLVLIGVGLGLVAGVVMPLLFGSEYNAAVTAFRLLLPGVMIFGMGRIFSTYFTNALGRPRVPLLIAGTSLAISLPLSLLLIPRFGMNGAALATSISYTASMLLAVWIFHDETGIPVRRIVLVTGEDVRDYVRFGQRMLAALPGAP